MSKPKREDRVESELVFVKASDVKIMPPEFVLDGMAIKGGLAVVQGEPKQGKSMLLAMQIANALGDDKLINAGMEKPGQVIAMFDEDACTFTVVPRLKAAGVSDEGLSRVHFLKSALSVYADTTKSKRMFSFAQDMKALRKEIERRSQDGPVYVFIDPLLNYCSGTDVYKQTDVRQVLMPLAEMAEEFGATFVIVVHERKASEGKQRSSAIHLSNGSGAIPQSARLVWRVSKISPDEDCQIFEVLTVKNNLSRDTRGFRYEIKERMVQTEKGQHSFPYAELVGRVNRSADEALREMEALLGNGASTGRRALPNKTEQAMEFTLEQLKGGPLSVAVMEERAGGRHAPKTLVNARNRLKDEGIVSFDKFPSGSTLWFIVSKDGDKGTEGIDGHKGTEGIEDVSDSLNEYNKEPYDPEYPYTPDDIEDPQYCHDHEEVEDPTF